MSGPVDLLGESEQEEFLPRSLGSLSDLLARTTRRDSNINESECSTDEAGYLADESEYSINESSDSEEEASDTDTVLQLSVKTHKERTDELGYSTGESEYFTDEAGYFADEAGYFADESDSEQDNAPRTAASGATTAYGGDDAAAASAAADQEVIIDRDTLIQIQEEKLDYIEEKIRKLTADLETETEGKDQLKQDILHLHEAYDTNEAEHRQLYEKNRRLREISEEIQSAESELQQLSREKEFRDKLKTIIEPVLSRIEQLTESAHLEDEDSRTEASEAAHSGGIEKLTSLMETLEQQKELLTILKQDPNAESVEEDLHLASEAMDDLETALTQASRLSGELTPRAGKEDLASTIQQHTQKLSTTLTKQTKRITAIHSSYIPECETNLKALREHIKLHLEEQSNLDKIILEETRRQERLGQELEEMEREMEKCKEQLQQHRAKIASLGLQLKALNEDKAQATASLLQLASLPSPASAAIGVESPSHKALFYTLQDFENYDKVVESHANNIWRCAKQIEAALRDVACTTALKEACLEAERIETQQRQRVAQDAPAPKDADNDTFFFKASTEFELMQEMFRDTDESTDTQTMIQIKTLSDICTIANICVKLRNHLEELHNNNGQIEKTTGSAKKIDNKIRSTSCSDRYFI